MHAENTAQRKYALTKIAAGDYILPGNDGHILWRIAKHIDGPSLGLDDWPRDREVWGVWKYERNIAQINATGALDPERWDEWEHWDGPFDTRAEAIAAALGCSS